MTARITFAPSSTESERRMQEMGLVEGTEFRVLKLAPLGDPIEIDLRGYRLCLRKQEMGGFELELVG